MIFALFFSINPIKHTYAKMIEPMMKVKLVNFLGNQKELTLTTNSEYKVFDSNISLQPGKTYLLKMIDKKLILSLDGNILASSDTFKIRPLSSNSSISINHRPYLGTIEFVIENNQFIRPINHVLLEDYLKGVVPIEMYPSWNIEALKTQAVAARTYATSYANRGVINDTISYQVYGGYVWTPNTTKAVNATKGQVLEFNGRLIDAVYSASNGGRTDSNNNTWGTKAVPYLPIKQDKYDPKKLWSFTIDKKQIDLVNKDLGKSNEWWSSTIEADPIICANMKAWLHQHGYSNKDIKIVSVSKLSMHNPTSGGRVSKGDIEIEFFVKDTVDNEGKLIPQQLSLINVPVSKIRSIVGNRMMISNLIDKVNNTSNVIKVQGFGDGHGVGMSQWGAKNRADAGQNYKAILKFYYPGTNLTPTTNTVFSKDQTAPIINNGKITLNKNRNKVYITYYVNESFNSTIYIKNSNGKIIRYFEKNVPKKAGKNTIIWNVSSVANGKYAFGIKTTDRSANQSSALLSYKLVKN